MRLCQSKKQRRIAVMTQLAEHGLMHRTKTYLACGIGFAALLTSACGSPRAHYKFQLQKVSQGDSLSDVSTRIAKPLAFENEDFKIEWSPGPWTFYFRIFNKSNKELTINFARSYLISPAGNAFDPVHPGNGAIAKGDDFILVPPQVGIDSWIRPGQQKGDNSGGIAGQLSPGFDGGGFFAEAGDIEEIKKAHSGKTALVVLNIAKGGKAESYRFALQVADITGD